jgi:hypothetical protein
MDEKKLIVLRRNQMRQLRRLQRKHQSESNQLDNAMKGERDTMVRGWLLCVCVCVFGCSCVCVFVCVCVCVCVCVYM